MPKPRRMMTARIGDRGHNLDQCLLGGQLRPTIAQASLRGSHRCIMACPITAGLPIGDSSGAPRRAAVG